MQISLGPSESAVAFSQQSALKKLGGGEEESSQAELEINGRIYEQKTTYMAQSSVVRIFASDITKLRQAEASLARLAMFPSRIPTL
jgi:hypothetical protein